VKNRPETGSPRRRLFSTPAGWFFARTKHARPAVGFVSPKCTPSTALMLRSIGSARPRAFALAAPFRMRAPQDEDEHARQSRSRCQTASLLRSRGAFLRPGFCLFASPSPYRGVAERRETFGCSAEHPCGVPY